MNVHLYLHDNGPKTPPPTPTTPTPARFGHCLVQQLGGTQYVQVVQHKHQIGLLPIHPEAATTAAAAAVAMIGHAMPCPCDMNFEHENTNVKQEKRTKVKAAVIVIPYRENGEVLITRRSASLRSFPQAYVFPGGAVDEGETLEEAAIREVFEETGLNIERTTMQLLCVWESVYPVAAQKAPPTAHHAMFCYAACISDKTEQQHHETTTGALSLSAEECDRGVFLGVSELQQIVESCNNTTIQQCNTHETILKGWRPVAVSGLVRDSADNKHQSTSEPVDISIQELLGVYPNRDFGSGTGEGHAYAAMVFLNAFRRNYMNTT